CKSQDAYPLAKGEGTAPRQKIVTSSLVQVQAVAGGGLGEGFFEEGGHVLYGAEAAGGGDLLERQGCAGHQGADAIHASAADGCVDAKRKGFFESCFEVRSGNSERVAYVGDFDSFHGVGGDEGH